MDKFKAIRSSISKRVAIGAAVGVLGLGVAGTALAAGGGNDKGGNAGGSNGSAPSQGEFAMPAPPPIAGDVMIGPGGPGPIGEDGSDEFASELAEKLGGDVTAGEIQTALDEIADEHQAEHRTAMAEAIADELDGVEAADVEAALEVAEEQIRSAFESGEMPEPGQFAQTLADELGISVDEVNSALEAGHGEGAAPGPMPGGPGGPPATFQMPPPDSSGSSSGAAAGGSGV